jgi:hypothetical protein
VCASAAQAYHFWNRCVTALAAIANHANHRPRHPPNSPHSAGHCTRALVQGNASAAVKCFQKAVDVTPEMAFECVALLTIDDMPLALARCWCWWWWRWWLGCAG